MVVQDANAFWYSGRSAGSDRASFMAYMATPDGHWPWYVGLRRTDSWRVAEGVGIGLPELESFRRRGLQMQPTRRVSLDGARLIWRR